MGDCTKIFHQLHDSDKRCSLKEITCILGFCRVKDCVSTATAYGNRNLCDCLIRQTPASGRSAAFPPLEFRLLPPYYDGSRCAGLESTHQLLSCGSVSHGTGCIERSKWVSFVITTVVAYVEMKQCCNSFARYLTRVHHAKHHEYYHR